MGDVSVLAVGRVARGARTMVHKLRGGRFGGTGRAVRRIVTLGSGEHDARGRLSGGLTRIGSLSHAVKRLVGRNGGRRTRATHTHMTRLGRNGGRLSTAVARTTASVRGTLCAVPGVPCSDMPRNMNTRSGIIRGVKKVRARLPGSTLPR